MDVSLPEGTLLKQSVPFSLCSSRHPVEWADSPSPGFQTGRDATRWDGTPGETSGAKGGSLMDVFNAVYHGLSWCFIHQKWWKKRRIEYQRKVRGVFRKCQPSGSRYPQKFFIGGPHSKQLRFFEANYRYVTIKNDDRNSGFSHEKLFKCCFSKCNRTVDISKAWILNLART